MCHLKQLYMALSIYPPFTTTISQLSAGRARSGQSSIEVQPNWIIKEKFGQHNAESLGDSLQWLHYVQFFLKQMFFQEAGNFPIVSNSLIPTWEKI